MKTFVMTCNARLDCLPGFAYLHNKHWGADQECIVCGFAAPEFDLPSNFTFFSLGPQQSYPVGKWSNALIRLLLHFPKEDVISLCLEDYYIVEPVNRTVIAMAVDYMRQFRNTLKFDLCAERRYAAGSTPYNDLGGVPLVKSDPNSAYHFSLWWGLWSRDLLLRVLNPDYSPWDIELRGTAELSAYGDEVVVVGAVSDPWPLRHTDIYRSGQPGQILLEELNDEDRAELSERGYI